MEFALTNIQKVKSYPALSNRGEEDTSPAAPAYEKGAPRQNAEATHLLQQTQALKSHSRARESALMSDVCHEL